MSSIKDIKTIWFFFHYAIPPDQPGCSRHYDFALELVKRGYQVVIFAAGFSHRSSREMKLAPDQTSLIEDVSGVKFVWVKTYPYFRNNWKRLANMISFKRRAQKLAMKLPVDTDISPPDLVVGASVHLFAVDAALNVAEHFGARFFVEVGDVWPQTLVDLGFMSNIHPFVLWMRRLEKRLYKKAERIITPLPRASDYFAELGIEQERVFFLPQGVPMTKKPMVPKRNSGDFTVGFVGSFGVIDDVGKLLQAAKLISDDKIRFLMVGDGEEKEKLVKWASSTGLTNVEFKEPVPKQEVPNLLNTVDICLIHYYKTSASHKYGAGSNKLIDYMAAGKPIIFAGDQPNDIITKVGCGMSVDDDPKMIAEAIETLSSMGPAGLRKMGKLGQDYVEKNHAIPVLVDKLEGLWKIDYSESKRQPSERSGTFAPT